MTVQYGCLEVGRTLSPFEQLLFLAAEPWMGLMDAERELAFQVTVGGPGGGGPSAAMKRAAGSMRAIQAQLRSERTNVTQVQMLLIMMIFICSYSPHHSLNAELKCWPWPRLPHAYREHAEVAECFSEQPHSTFTLMNFVTWRRRLCCWGPVWAA